MKLLEKCWDFFRRWNAELDQWYLVSFDSEFITQNVRPPGREPWVQAFRWNEIEKILFIGRGGFHSDELYFFTTQRPESFVVPTQASGGHELLQELIARKYFDSPEFTKILLSPYGAYWWPEALNEEHKN
jgi:hypothetical protein